ncbi:MAG: tripartite tricarboxylate transporter substrate binding protein [Betaproteobacteria bacterium]|nr:tripartite tricarboxylate transporter substrate binding protein [Betaproteobacteria bacterium]MBI2509305.1 tripartite tricarboxylate transporter substrate binding protein [Betaproteobacteria bacterium]
MYAINLTGLFVFLIACGQALAQGYPAGPVRVIVPFPAGGGVDSMGRLIGQKLTEALGRQFVIDNRPGANGMIGSEAVARSARDGYTLLVNGANLVTSASLYRKVTYDPVKDFDAVSLIAHAPNVLIVHPSLPAKSVAQLVSLAKTRPGQVLYAGSGSGSTPHLAAELFNTLARVRMVHVPYRGTGPAIIGLMSGEASVMFMPTTNAVPLVRSGRLRGLAVTSRERVPALGELPTVAESGLKGYESSQWYGLLAPAGTPADVLNLLNGRVVKIMHESEMKQRMTDGGNLAVGSTRDAFAAHVREEYLKWAKVIKESGARVD